MSARGDLGTLEASGLIEIAALQPELEYLFKHALVQEAAYASLLKQDRRSLHSAAAQSIRSLYPGRERELAGVIGMHLEQAGETKQAAEQFVIAGEHAQEIFATKEALALFERAGSLADETQVELRLRAAIGGAKAGWTFPESVRLDNLERAVAAAGAGDPRLLAEGYFWVAFLRKQKGEIPETSAALKHALEQGERLGVELNDPTAAALPKALIGSFNAFTGNLRQGAEQMREALEVLHGRVDSLSTAMVSVFLALSYARLGDFAAARETIDRAGQFATEADAISRLDVDIARSGVALELGEPEEARTRAQSCTAIAEDLGAYACVVAANMMLGAANLAREDASSAKPPLERGNELSGVTNMAVFQTLIQALLGSTRVQLGDMPGGVAAWDEALSSARQMSDRYGEAQTLWGRGRTLVKQANPDHAAALADFDRAIELFEAMEARPSLARSLSDRAAALRAVGRAAEAAEDDRRSLELGRQLGLKDPLFRI